MSDKNLVMQREVDSKIISEEDEELNDFYHQLQITPNPSLSNLDGCSLESSESIQESGRNFFTPFKVKNILANCQDDKTKSKENLEMIDEDENQFECSNILKGINNSSSPSPSLVQQRAQGETTSSGFLSCQYDNDATNELFSTEKFENFDFDDNSALQQKLNYTIDIDDFMLNCTPNPFSVLAQKRAEKVFIHKRIGEIKKKKFMTKKLYNKHHSKNSESQSIISPSNKKKNNAIEKENYKNSDNFLKRNSDIQTETYEQIKNKVHPSILKTNYQIAQQNIRHDETNKINHSQYSQIKNQNQQTPLKISIIPCKCRKSQCLKLYCECFSRGEICGPSCICLECRNSTEYLEQRNNAIKSIEVKNPQAFILNVNSSSTSSNFCEQKQMKIQHDSHILNEIKKGCNCKKSKCKKKYCECYMAGKQCSLFCQCIDCTNNIPHSHSSPCKSPQSEEQTNQEVMSFIQAANQPNQSQVINTKKDQSLLNLLKDFNKMNEQLGIRETNQLSKLTPIFNQINQKENNKQDEENISYIKNNMQLSKNKKDSISDSKDYQNSTQILNSKKLTKQQKIIMKNNKKIIKFIKQQN